MIKQEAAKGVAWTTIAALAGNLLQLLQLVWIARYITAVDYGLMSLTLIVVYVGQVFGDIGTSGTIVFNRSLAQDDYSNLFWLSAFMCLLMGLLLILLAPLAGYLLNQPAIIPVIRLASLFFLFLPFQVQYNGILKRSLQFKRIANADILSKLMAFAAGVVLATRGYGVYALMGSALAGIFVNSALLFFWGRTYAPLRMRFSLRHLRPLLKPAAFQAGNDILNYLNFQADTLILASFAGVDTAGIYSFAKNLAARPSQLINPIFTQVAFPLLSAVNHSVNATRVVFKGFLGHITMLNSLVYPFIAVFADTIVDVFFGSRWLGAVHVLQVLSCFFLVRSIFNPLGALLTARGMARRLFYWNLVLIFVLPPVVYAAAKFGPVHVATVLVVLFLILFLPMWRYLLFPVCGISFQALLRCITRPLLTSTSLLIVLLLFKKCSPMRGGWELVAGVIAWLFAGTVLLFLISRSYFNEMIGFFRTKF
ncbi:MAG: MOP flippase family protein [Bacteroidota bacterium]|nr:MOP flippase family protein [Bacteroidota bacterium]